MKVKHLAIALSFFALPTVWAANSNTELSVPINLNTADSKTLCHSVKGIGIKRAEAIIKYREEHHGFKAIDELAQVAGLGKKFVSSHAEELKKTFIIG